MQNADVLRSGSFGVSANSARAGFLPICLLRAPREVFDGIPVYLRASRAEAAKLGTDVMRAIGRRE